MPETVKTFVNRCRCCLEKFFENEKISKITNFFGFQFFAFTCLPLQESEHLSQFVCEFCHSELLRFSVFKKDLIEKQQKLNDLLKHHNDKTRTREQRSSKHSKLKIILISDESEVDDNGDSAEESDEHEDSLSQVSPSETDDEKDQDFLANFDVVKVNGGAKSATPPSIDFKCDYCNQTFKAKQGLTRHVQSHINLSVPWKCELDGCGFAGSSKVKLNLHKRDVHAIPYIKPIKGHLKADSKATNKKTPMKRSKKAQSRTLPCFCGASFLTPFSLRAHKNRMHGRKNKCIYGCVNVQYVKNGHFLRHVQFKHPEKLEECLKRTDGYVMKSSSTSNLLNNVTTEILKCDRCDFKTLKKSTLKLHVQTHLHHFDRPKFECRKCHKLFARATNLRIHEAAHDEAKRNKLLKSSSGPFKHPLNDHMALIHAKNPSKKFKCSICDRLFLKRFTLECHQRSSHKSVPPTPLIVSAFSTAVVDRRFKCHCGKSFPFKSRLIKHQAKHGTSEDPSTEKLFKCPQPGCSHAFTQRCNLIRHQKAKEHLKVEEIENLKYSCSCGAKFFSVRGFAFHTEKMKCKN